MSPEEKELLQRSVDLAEENNKILHILHRHMKIRRAMSIAYWVLIIGVAIGAFYFVEPFVQRATEMYDGAKENIDSFNSIFQTNKE